MAITYIIGGITVPGVQTTWNRIVAKSNSDGSLVYSPWLDHIWKIARLEMPIWNALQTLEGAATSGLASNHIESGNTQVIYDDVIFESLRGTARGHQMLNVEIQLSVKESAFRWWVVPGLAATPLVVYQPKGALNFDASLTNLANPGTNDAVLGTAPAFDTSLGWTFDGVDDFLDSTFVISGVNSMFVRINNMPEVVDTGHIIGANAAFEEYSFDWEGLLAGPPLSTQRITYTYPALFSPFFIDTFFIINGVPVPDHVLGIYFEQGIRTAIYDQLVSSFSALNTTPSPTVYMGALNDGVSAINFFPGDIIAVAIYSGDITISQAKQISANMAAI